MSKIKIIYKVTFMDIIDKVIKFKMKTCGYLCISVSGDCMEPIINDGDIIRIEYVNDSLKIGDIVLIKHCGYFKIHRIIDIKDNRYITKGDNMPYSDGAINFDDVYGKYSCKVEKYPDKSEW